MFEDTASHHDPQPRLFNLLATALTPITMLGRLMNNRQAYQNLTRLDDYMLKDIGLSRGDIHAAVHHGRRPNNSRPNF